jgi:hypothetical protein
MSLLLVVAGRWGYHRDELYYVVGGQHPAWGYVDHPPLTPALARWSNAIFPKSLTGFRLLPALVSSALLIVAAATAIELGGSHRAAAVAALAALACPMLLAGGHRFQTVPFDQLFGALAILVWLHLLGGGNSLWWLVLGLLVGAGLENKWTMLLVVGAIGVGTLASADLRGDLASPWLWLGVVLAIGLWAPNLRWQIRHRWPTLNFIRDNSSAFRHDEGWAAFLWQQLGVLGVPLLVFAAAGIVWAWREPEWRPATLGVVTIILVLAVVGAKPYYHGAFLPFVFATGALALDGWVESSQTRLVIAVAVWAVLAVPFTLPLLPPGTAANLGVLSANNELAEELGWPELVDQIAAAYKDLPDEQRADARVMTRTYGEAAAVELLGPERGIPAGTTLCGHNSYVDWWPDDQPAGAVISIRVDATMLAEFFEQCDRVDHVRNKLGVKNQVAGAPILVCRGLKASPQALRAAVRFTR